MNYLPPTPVREEEDDIEYEELSDTESSTSELEDWRVELELLRLSSSLAKKEETVLPVFKKTSEAELFKELFK